MDAKEIERHGRDLSKAASAGESSETLLKFMSDLRTGVRASEDLLRSTKIGITVNKLKQHKDPNVSKHATELVTKWRKDVNRSGSAGANPGSPGPTANIASSVASASKQTSRAGSNGVSTPTEKTSKSSNGSGTSTPMNVDSEEPKVKVAPELRSAIKDGVNTKVTGNTRRDKALGLLYNGLAFMSEQPPKQLLSVATEIEAAMHSSLGPETEPEYQAKVQLLFTNFKNKTNTKLRESVSTRDTSAEQLLGMSGDDLKSAETIEMENAMYKENVSKASGAQEDRAISKDFKCGKCGQKKVSYTQAQTRSADEPMTTFCSCMNCGNRWKFS